MTGGIYHRHKGQVMNQGQQNSNQVSMPSDLLGQLKDMTKQAASGLPLPPTSPFPPTPRPATPQISGLNADHR